MRDIEENKKGLKLYRQVLKEHGMKGLLKTHGWKVVLMIVLFFSIKGTISLLLILGGVELIRGLF